MRGERERKENCPTQRSQNLLVLNYLPLQMANDAKIKKRFIGKNQIQGTVKKTWPTDDSKGMT